MIAERLEHATGGGDVTAIENLQNNKNETNKKIYRRHNRQKTNGGTERTTARPIDKIKFYRWRPDRGFGIRYVACFRYGRISTPANIADAPCDGRLPINSTKKRKKEARAAAYGPAYGEEVRADRFGLRDPAGATKYRKLSDWWCQICVREL